MNPVPEKKTALALRSFMSRSVAALLLLAPAISLAQVAPPAPDARVPADEGIVLSPFEVRTDRDYGYTAVDALAGGRTDTPLKQTPSAVSVMTRQFLDDIAATTYSLASEWGVNSVPNYPVAAAPNPQDFGINLRGMGNSFPSRNYFVWYVNTDAYNTERYEYARGPNGVLFGDGNVGGIVTIFTKRPQFGRDFYNLSARVDSWGSYRGALDINKVVNDKLALRVNAFDGKTENWRDRFIFPSRGLHLSGAVRITRDDTFRFEAEAGELVRHIGGANYSDLASYWDGVTSYGGPGAPLPSTTGTGVARIAGSPYTLYIPAVPQAGYADWSTFYRSNGSNVYIRPEGRTDLPNIPVLRDRAFNLQPPNSILRLLYYTYTGYFEHRFTDDFFVQVAYNRFRYQNDMHNGGATFGTHAIDVNRYLPLPIGAPPGTVPVPNPKFGVPYSDQVMVQQKAGNMVDDVRAMGSYRFETSFLNQAINLIAGSRIDRYNSIDRRLFRTNGPTPNINNTANVFRWRLYWDEPGRYTLTDEPPKIPGIDLAYLPTGETHERKALDYFQIASVSRLLSDRLTVMLGARKDLFHRSQITNVASDPVTGLPILGGTFIPPGEKNPVTVVGAKAKSEARPLSKNAGFVYFVKPWIGVYANYSETFAPPTSGPNLIDGTIPGISRSQGEDLGIKLSLWQGKVSGTINYYESVQKDNLAFTNANQAQINRLWTNVGRPDLANLQYRDTNDFRGDGYEIDFTANPTRNLRLMFNLAFPRTAIVDVQPGLRRYFDAHLPTWQAGADDPNNSQRVQMQADIDAIRANLAGLVVGATQNNTAKYTSNVYGTYTFRRGWLNNVSTGLGANIRGKVKIGNTRESPFDYLYSEPYYLLSGHVSYEHKFRPATVVFQLNVSNILDRDDLITTSYTDVRAGGLATNPIIRVPNAFRYLDPRRFTFTTTLKF
jgi:outer membrane receptor protein involved in Fe transport